MSSLIALRASRIGQPPPTGKLDFAARAFPHDEASGASEQACPGSAQALLSPHGDPTYGNSPSADMPDYRAVVVPCDKCSRIFLVGEPDHAGLRRPGPHPSQGPAPVEAVGPRGAAIRQQVQCCRNPTRNVVPLDGTTCCCRVRIRELRTSLSPFTTARRRYPPRGEPSSRCSEERLIHEHPNHQFTAVTSPLR